MTKNQILSEIKNLRERLFSYEQDWRKSFEVTGSTYCEGKAEAYEIARQNIDELIKTLAS